MRKRLTSKKASEEVLYPGNVNFPERQFVDQKKYDNYEELVGYDLPNMEKDWQKDSRNEVGLPNATIASTRAAASQAVKLAIYLLGDKATESMIKEQSLSFMRLGGKEISASLSRFETIASMYQAEDEIEEEVAKAKKAKKSEDTDDETVEAKKTEDEEIVETETVEAKKSEDEVTEEEVTEAKKSEDTEEDTVEAKKSEDEDEDEDEDETTESKKSDDDFFASDEEEVKEEVTASLKSLYLGGVKSVASITKPKAKSTKTAAKKESINVDDLSSIWAKAPEISDYL